MINSIVFDKNYCESCYNNHIDGILCLSLSDSNNDCQCLCDGSLGNIDGLTPENIEELVNKDER